MAGLNAIAPSVNLASTGAFGGHTIAAYIRGVGASSYNYNVEPGVAFYVDDVYLGPSYGLMLSLIDIDQVEVLRGPQGTLSGKNAIGGAVKLITQKPKGDDSGYVQVEGGSYNLVRVRAAYDMSLIEDQLFARVTGYSSHRDGYVKVYDFGCVNPGEAGDTSAPYGLKNTQPQEGCQRGTLGDEDVHARPRAIALDADEQSGVQSVGRLYRRQQRRCRRRAHRHELRRFRHLQPDCRRSALRRPL